MRKNILIVGCSFSHHTTDGDDVKQNSWADWLKEEFSDNLYICNISTKVKMLLQIEKHFISILFIV